MSVASLDPTEAIERWVRPIEDWPEPGVTFRDITPLLGDHDALSAVLDELAARARDLGVDAVVGVEARGFVLGAPLALALGVGFVPVRKQGKLPAQTHQVSYDLEYGSETLEIHADALQAGARVLVVDDVLATGGTLVATTELVRTCGADVAANAVLLEIAALDGRARLGDEPLICLHTY